MAVLAAILLLAGPAAMLPSPLALASEAACGGDGDCTADRSGAGGGEAGDELGLLQAAGRRGCGGAKPPDLARGRRVTRSIRVKDTDPSLGTITRKYDVTLPRGYDGKDPLPLLLYFHGWCDSKRCNGCHWDELASEQNFIMVYPRGKTEDVCSSWNVGHAGSKEACVFVPKITEETRYESCRIAGKTGPCNCYTCYDDVKFVSDLVRELERDLCVNPKRIYASGASNGGIFLYYLIPQLVERGYPVSIAGAVSWSGAVFQGNERALGAAWRAASLGVSIFELHGTEDRVVPMYGGESNDGFLYLSTNQNLGHYVRLKQCKRHATEIDTRFDGKEGLRQCYEFPDCKSGGRLVYCKFKASHYLWPSYAEEMAWMFLRGSRLQS